MVTRVRARRRIILVLPLLLLPASLLPQASTPVYRDATQPVDRRVADLLGRMTLAEKVGQLNVTRAGELGRDPDGRRAGCRSFAAGTLVAGVGPCGGVFTPGPMG